MQMNLDKLMQEFSKSVQHDVRSMEPTERWRQETMRRIRHLPVYGSNGLESVWLLRHFWKFAPLALSFILVLGGMLVIQDFTSETSLAMRFFGVSSGMEYLAFSGLL